jgi:hypothetical protein
MVVAAADVAIVWLVDEAHVPRRVLETHAEGGAIDLERQRRRCDGPAIGSFIHRPVSGGWRIVHEQP